MTLGEHLRARGKARAFGELILTFASVPSTNDLALDYARRGFPHGSLLLADAQTAGRGRWRRSWSSPAEVGLYLSVVLRPGAAVPPSLVSLAASVAAAEALREISAAPVSIRWPNDLYLESQKLGGILSEASFSGETLDFVVVGFGVNLNQEMAHFEASQLATRATSLRLATGRNYDRLLVAAAVVEKLEHWWSRLERDTPSIVSRWRELAQGYESTRVSVHAGTGQFEAETAGVADDGGLRLLLADGSLQTLHSGDVLSLRDASSAAVTSAEDGYYSAVERHFVALRGSPLFITSSEWHLVHCWYENEIPLRVVFPALDRAVERALKKPRNHPLRLSACRPTVEAAFRRFREALVGAASAPERQADSSELADYLRKLSAALDERCRGVGASELRPVLAECARRVGELAATSAFAKASADKPAFAKALAGTPSTLDSLTEIESELDRLEAELIHAAERVLGEGEREACRREAEASLEAYRPRMPSSVFRSAVESAYIKKVRSRFGLPPLSLFHL